LRQDGPNCLADHVGHRVSCATNLHYFAGLALGVARRAAYFFSGVGFGSDQHSGGSSSGHGASSTRIWRRQTPDHPFGMPDLRHRLRDFHANDLLRYLVIGHGSLQENAPADRPGAGQSGLGNEVCAARFQAKDYGLIMAALVSKIG
jgi:hypothetical protein